MGMYAGHFDFAHKLLWTVPALLSPAECAALAAGDREWLPATVNRLEGRAVEPSLRSSTTAVLRDEALAEDLYQRVKPHVPDQMSTEIGARGRVRLTVTGVHLPLRIYRYEPGQHFGLHQDQSYFRADGAQSLLTFMVYLNDDFEGGETEFPEQAQTIVPATGTALLFQHRLLHAGTRVKKGVKLVLRSDVLYQEQSAHDPGANTPATGG